MNKTRERFVSNDYNFKTVLIDDIKKEMQKQFQLSMKVLEKEYPHKGFNKVTSTGTKRVDYAFYTGTGGNIWFYWRNYLMDKANKANLNKFKEAYEANVALVKKTNSSSPSFFMSSSGIYCLGCILAKELNDATMFYNNLKVLLDFNSLCTKDSEDELLYGTAGYLYALLLVHVECQETFHVSLEKEIAKIALLLIDNGVNQMNHFGLNCLTYPFPKMSYDKYSLYLGAAHGAIGVLYEILCAVRLFPSVFTQQHLNVLKQSLKEIEKLQFVTGNFPTLMNEQDNDEKVHWCHGAVGAIHLFNLANIVFEGEDFLKTALKCGSPLWTRGILLKGNGLCHGISGTVYGLYKLYQITKEDEYLQKAFAMIQATYDPKVREKVKKYEDPQRKMIGVPDTPYSLMEGMEGCLTMYCDLLSGNVLFPGYEII